MPWTKLHLVMAVFALIVSSGAVAQRIDFSTPGSAQLTSRIVPARGLDGVEFELTVPSVEVEKQRDGFDAVRVPGLYPLAQPGNPALSTTGALVAVPDGYEPVVSILSKEERTVEGTWVAPFQPQFRCATGPQPFYFHSALYRADTVYPESPVTLEEVGRLRGVRLVRVGLNPVRFSPSEKKLYVATELRARVAFTQTHRVRPLALPTSFYQLVRRAAANGSSLEGLLVSLDSPEVILIVTADAYKAALTPFIEWKQAKGYKVVVVTNTEAGKTKENVKKYIKNFYDTQALKPSYLLLVGNKTTQPGFMESTSSGAAASDWQYTLLNGSDNIPDVFYGRLVADNEAEVATQIQRWIQYEKSPEIGGTWYPMGTTIASNDGFNPSDKEYAQQVQAALKAGTYTHVDGFYQGEQTATPVNISNAVTEGRSWLAYFGHGSGTGWDSTNTPFNNSTVQQLKNENKLPILIDVACQNGSWVNLAKCFGKVWVTHTSSGQMAGAVGYYGGSVNISWHEPAVMSVGVAKYHFEKPVENLGGSVLAGQLYLFEKMGTGNNTLDNLKWYNLFGDPSLIIRTSPPVEYDVKHATRMILGRVEITVLAEDTNGKPVKGLKASLSTNAGVPLAVGETDEWGQTTLAVPGTSTLPPNTVLTTTGYNAETKHILVDN